MKYIKCILVSSLWGIFTCLTYLATNQELFFSDIVFKFSLPTIMINLVFIIEMSLRYFPFLIFQILFGTHIYKHFCSASVFYFSRCQNRAKWFLKEAISLYPLALLYSLAMVVAGLIVAGINNRIIYDRESFIILIYYLLIHSLWLYSTTLLINILAIKLESSMAYTIVAGIQLTFLGLLLLWDETLPLHGTYNLERNARLLQLNPIAHLALPWRSSFIESVNSRINEYLDFFMIDWSVIDFELNNSIVLFTIISIIVIILGVVIVKKHELISIEMEKGGI